MSRHVVSFNSRLRLGLGLQHASQSAALLISHSLGDPRKVVLRGGRCGFRGLLRLAEKSVNESGHLLVGEAAESNKWVSGIVAVRVSRRSLFVRSHEVDQYSWVTEVEALPRLQGWDGCTDIRTKLEMERRTLMDVDESNVSKVK